MLEPMATIFIKIASVSLITSDDLVNTFMTDHRNSVRIRMPLDLLGRPLFRSHFFNNIILHVHGQLSPTDETLLPYRSRLIGVTGSVLAI